jgi:hypothetical protein
MCISISLFLITFFNISFAFITNIKYMLLLRLLTGFANNLSTFMQSYLLEIFPSEKHKTVLQLFTFFQNLAVALAMLSGLIISLTSALVNDENIYSTNDKLNRYFLIAFLVAIINFMAFIFNFIKYKFKIVIPKRRTQFYEQCDLNLDLSQRKESIIQRQGSKYSHDYSGNKRYSNRGSKEYSINVIDKSNLHNPNKSPSDRYNPFGTLNSNKTINDDKNLSKSIELQPKHPEDNPIEEKEIPINGENIVEINSLHNTIKKNEIDFDNYEKNQINRTVNNPLSPNDKIQAGFFQLNEEPQELSNNRESSNLDLSKNTIGIKHTNRLTQITDKSEIKEINEDFGKISIIRSNKINKNLPIKRQGSSDKQNEIFVSSTSENIIRSNSINSEASIRGKIDFFILFKISLIYTNLQICDIVLYNIFFLNLTFKLNLNPKFEWEENIYNIIIVSSALALYHLIYTMLMPAINSQIVKIGMKSNKKANTVFKMFIYVSLILMVIFHLVDYSLSYLGLINLIVLMSLLILRNLALTVVLICYNVMVLKISQSQVKEKINLFQNYFSLSLRTISGMICCFFYVYFIDNYLMIAICLGCIPLLLLVSNLKLIKNLMDLVY